MDAPPLEYLDDNGREHGFAVDVFESIAELEGWELEWVHGPWPDLVSKLEAGEIDLLFPVLPTPERRRQFEFSKRSMFETWGRVFANPAVQIESIQDLDGKTLAVMERDFFGDEIRNMLEKFGVDCEIRVFEGKREILDEVASGACDAGALEGFVNLWLLEDYALDMTPIVFAPAAPHIVTRKGQDLDLIEAIDNHLGRLLDEEDGLYSRAFEDWFGFRDRVTYSPVGKWTLLAIVGTLIALGIATFILRVKVNERNSELIAIGMRNRGILEEMPVMLNAIGEDGHFVVWNKECERVTGYLAEEILGNPDALELLYPDPEYREQVAERAVELDYEYHDWERHYVGKDGKFRHLSTSSISKRCPVAGWKAWGIGVDITERKNAEEALRSSEERMRLVTDNVPVLIAQLDNQELFTYCNARAREWFALKPSEIVGKHAGDVLGEDLWKETQGRMLEAQGGRQVSFETTWRRPDGALVDVGVMIVPDMTSVGEAVGFYVLIADITERRNAEKARLKLQDQLRYSQKLEAVGELAGGVAHDFRNLLTVIVAHTDYVRSEVADNRLVLRSLDTVEEAVSQASIVTRALLTFSKKLDTVMVPTDLCGAIENTTQMIVRTFTSLVDVQVDAECDPLPWIEADPTQIQQVLLNLVLNARDAMPDGGTLTIQVHPDPKASDRVQLVVRDTGCGMTPEIRLRVFEPFFTTKGDERGTGLGLAIVHGIVEGHDGEIRVESEVGVGTAFIISFPLTERRDEVGRRPLRRELPEGKGEMILLAEQNHQVLQIVAATLKEFGYEVIKARDGLQLIESFELNRDQIRLMVLDVELPKRAGSDVLRELRARGERVPAILISTNTGAMAEDLLDEDTVLLPKPFQMTELANEVHELLTRERTKRGGG